ncbi:MAG: polyhydroxyalkanoate depolymerase [Rhizobacter sp.]|nr:polyhydroxyalkanoate depolymerase [Rhizobacter sp.]
MMYEGFLAHADALWPLRVWGRLAAPALLGAPRASPLGRHARRFGAAWQTFALAELTHERPSWGIATVTSEGAERAVVEEVATATPFATLRRFCKQGVGAQPKVLLAAPMSGHFATLLRDTVRTLLRDHDVYVTDWHNARDVPLAAGRFGLDEYIEHMVKFLAALGPGANVVAVCQPCVAALAAAALMAEDDHPAQPASLTLMAGPIDCRIAPTAVNELATSRPLEWFERHLIASVPWRLPGAGRRVYPGFLQLAAFMSMNKERHAEQFRKYFGHVAAGEHDEARAIRDFYEEYMAVSDLSADFYLETVRLVFQEYALARGTLTVRGRKVDPLAMRRTALLTIEGERDDICALGQTLAAHDLTRLRPYLRTHHVQPNVGHYGVFAGRRWQQHIYPVVRNVIQVSQ